MHSAADHFPALPLLPDTFMRLLPSLLLSAIFTAVPLHACSVPVFRYALEHWQPDAFQAVVFHRGSLSESQRAWVRDLGADGLAGRLHANLSPRTVDLDDNPSPEMLELSHQSDTGALPWVVVQLPRSTKLARVVWSGPLDEETVRQILDSPARREIVERLGDGQSAVWVLLESGDREADAAAAKLLEARLSDLVHTLTLPALDPNDIVNGLISVGQGDLRLDFSMLRIARTDSAEQPFIQMLLGTETDLKDAKEPIVIPVFGRGRALYAFVGAGIKRETIDQAASFLIGKCSCQVKELNPGTDLLLAANWDELVRASTTAAPDLPPLSELTKFSPETVSFGGGEKASPKQPLQGTLYLAASIAAALLAAGFLVLRRG